MSIIIKSETYYSLKEMETIQSSSSSSSKPFEVGNLLLSERDGNKISKYTFDHSNTPVGNLLLSERDGNLASHTHRQAVLLFVGNLLLSERDGNQQ